MYMGEWLGGLRQGYGCELGGDGDWYRGQFDDDAITGWVRNDSFSHLLSL
jgi:MORN repeat